MQDLWRTGGGFKQEVPFFLKNGGHGWMVVCAWPQRQREAACSLQALRTKAVLESNDAQECPEFLFLV